MLLRIFLTQCDKSIMKWMLEFEFPTLNPTIDCLGDGRLRCMKALFAEAPSMFTYFTSNPHVDKQ
jgi:hypothetical protein